MPKFNRATGPIRSEQVPSGKTHQGAPGFKRDAKSELFLLAVSNFVGEDTFYERAGTRDSRYAQLVRTVTHEDPAWAASFLAWLRESANMRSAALVGAAHFTEMFLADNRLNEFSPQPPHTARAVIQSVLQRPDEPGEFLAYWTKTFGRKLPQPVKRGVADAVRRMYSERSLLKYDTASHAWRFGDVINMTHAVPRDERQSQLFRYALDNRFGHVDWTRQEDFYNDLPMLGTNVWLRSHPADSPYWVDYGTLRNAGMTWEDVLSAVGDKRDKRDLWEALIPSMGYMALLRNLRNFTQAGIGRTAVSDVTARLTDPDEVSRSRQLPFRFLSAVRAADPQWAPALGKALDLSLRNLPEFTGRTLILIDTSASMSSASVSKRSTVTPAMAASLFGIALAKRNAASVDVYGYADGVFSVDISDSALVLDQVQTFQRRIGEVGHGTRTAYAVQQTFAAERHDRVIIFTDEQAMDTSDYSASGWIYAGPGRSRRRVAAATGTVSESVPAEIPLYTFNLQGYEHGHAPAGIANRYELGGLTDHTFAMIPLLEAGQDANWPF